jgi:hypothetical protein
VWPEGKKFAFTVFDDTDNDVIDNVQPVYELLAQCNMRTSKSVWVYRPRDGFRGLGLLDARYLEFIRTLAGEGFEICLHNVGSGEFDRTEIKAGMEFFRDHLGFYPNAHSNHVSNPDNLYWGRKRFVAPLSFLYSAFTRVKGKSVPSLGDEEASPYFWGDIAKERVKYVRNLTFNDINTLRADPGTPYIDKRKPYVNYWFSSSDGHTVEEFTDLIHPANADRLESEGGLCIVYTHFASGFVNEEGQIDARFAERIRGLSERPGWFVPVSEVLDWILDQRSSDCVIGHHDQLRLNLLWARDRIIKRLAYHR